MAKIEAEFLKLYQNVDQLKTSLEAHLSNARSQDCSTSNTADQNSTPCLFSTVAVCPPKPTLDPLCTVKVYPKSSSEPNSDITSAETKVFQPCTVSQMRNKIKVECRVAGPAFQYIRINTKQSVKS